MGIMVENPKKGKSFLPFLGLEWFNISFTVVSNHQKKSDSTIPVIAPMKTN